jgi:uncharacterized protein
MAPPVHPTLIAATTAYVQTYMSRFDGSHDYSHIRRVVRLARHIHALEQHPTADLGVVTLAALLHDVGDRKYLPPGEDPSRMVHDVLVGELGADVELAERVQSICAGVSYSGEVKNPDRVKKLVAEHPECE